MDVKITFLNGYLEEDIYMEQPLDFTSNDGDHKVSKLQRSIYELKKYLRVRILDSMMRSNRLV